jgi:ankyrin repeat protein
VSDIEILKWVLQHGADPNVKNSRGATPLATAVIMDKPLEAQLLLDHGAAVEPHLIHRALRAASGVGESMFRLLLEAGVDINYDSPEYGTPLHLAAYDGDKDTVEMLLRLGANPNIAVRDHAGEAFTPAGLAKRQGNDDICDLLNAAAALS